MANDSKIQSLAQAVAIARNATRGDMAHAASALAGCPVGGWPETEQAMRAIRDALPLRSTREYTTAEFVSAVYYVDHADRYRSVFAREEEAKRDERIARASRRAVAIGRLEIEVRPAPSRRTISVYVDEDGYICTDGGLWEEIADRVPAAWIAQARDARLAILRAGEVVS